MKVLFVSNTDPYSKRFGAEQRAYMILSALNSLAIQVDVAYVGNQSIDKPANNDIVYWKDFDGFKINCLHSLCQLSTLKMYPKSNSISASISNIIESGNYDAIICRYIHTAYLCNLEKYKTKLIIDFDDWPVSAIKACLPATADVLHKFYHRMMIYGVKRLTYKSIKSSAKTLLANQEESNKYGCGYLPNISLNRVEKVTHIPDCQRVLFIGKLDYAPNHQGIDRFLKNVWPQVIKEKPNAEFFIAGIGVDDHIKKEWEQYTNVKVLGFVEDIHEFYKRANVVVCPIYSGSGTNIKSVESICMAKATVMSSFAAKGISSSLQNGVNALISNTDEEMSENIIKLIDDDSFCNSVQAQAFDLAEKVYSQTAVADILLNLIKSL